MTREETIEAIKVMQAWVDGKEIEARNRSQPQWFNMSKEPRWDWHYWDYRIKPTKKLRPWTPDEVPLGAWMRAKGYEYRRIIMSTSNEWDREKWLDSAEHSTDFGKTWLPCGVEVDCE